MIRTLAAVAALVVAAETASAATVVFNENFDKYATGGSILNFEGGDVFDARFGTVDLIKSGEFSIDCVGNTGGCIDLNGTSGNPARLSYTATFDAGVRYRLSFDLSGSQRPEFSLASDTVTYGNMQLLTAKVTRMVNDPFMTYTLEFVGNGSTNTIFFKNGGPNRDNIGAVLDNASLVAGVPVPAAGLMLLAALGGLGFARRRKAA